MSTDRLEWFKVKSKYFQVRSIEVELDFPIGTIQKWIKGERKLNESRIVAMDKFLDDLLFGVGISEPNIMMVNAPVIDELRERVLKEESINPDPLLAVKRMVAEKRPKIHSEPKESPGDIVIPVVINKEIGSVNTITGEIKKVREIVWKFNGLDKMDKVENYIYTDGTLFAVMRYFASIKKYAILDTIEEAREIVNSIK
jgi:hypothetical protein